MTRLEFHAVHDPEYGLAAAAVHVRPADVDRHRRWEAIGRGDADPGLTLETAGADRDSELAGRGPSIPERLSKLKAGLNPRSRREAAPRTAHRFPRTSDGVFVDWLPHLYCTRVGTARSV